MNRDAIERACTWGRPDTAELVVPSVLFAGEMKVKIFTLRDGLITDAQIAGVNDLIAVPRDDSDKLVHTKRSGEQVHDPLVVNDVFRRELHDPA